MVASPAVSPPVPSTLVPVTLVLGGARSGKSGLAEGLLSGEARRTYLATAEAGDAEMAARIADHRARRGPGWTTLEEPLELVPALARATAGGGAVLVDCLTLWLGNLLGAGRDAAAEGDRLVAALPGLAGPVVLVSNEVGLGIVPDNALARAFRDEAGRLHQAIAAVAQRVLFVAAGLPLILKDQPA
jgi:adenosylcobinamide kinase/adenosylcobinamide-phosphate guanylyltransferase